MKRHTAHRAKKGAWFVPLRGSFLPVNTKGWSLYTLYVIYLVATLLYVWFRAVDMLDYVVTLPLLLLAGLVSMTLVAERHS